MSLINTMLQDLEARRAVDAFSDGRLQPLPQVPVARLGYLRWIIAAVVLVGSGAIFWWLQISGNEPRIAIPAASVAIPVASIAAPASSPSPVATHAAPIDGSIQGQPLATIAPAAAPLAAAGEQQAIATTPVAAPLAATELRLETRLPDSPELPYPVSPQRLVASQKTEAERRAEPKRTVSPRLEKTDRPMTPQARAEALMRAAQSALASGNAAEARDLWRQSLSEVPVFAPARRALLRDSLDRNALEESETLLREGIAFQPKQLEWPLTLARLYVAQGHLPKARALLSEVQPEIGENPDYLGFLGALAFRAGDMTEASDAYQRAVRAAPNDGRWWFGLGLALDGQNRGSEAREAFLRARSSNALPQEMLATIEQKLR